MIRKTAIVLLSGLLLCACAQMQPAAPPAPPPPAPAPAPAATTQQPGDHYVTIRTATCDRYLALSDEDRDDASMFYIGYQARRFRSRAINVGTVPTIENRAIDYCRFYPSQTVDSAFAAAYLEAQNR